MPTSTPDPVFAVDDPVSLIRSRMQEKRLFEARFLCRQLAGDMDGTDKKALESELTGLLARVEQLRRQARALVAEGRRNEAAEAYGEIAAIAIDVPGIAEEQRALEGAEVLAARIAGKASERPGPAQPSVPVDVRPQEPAPAAVPERAPQAAVNRQKKGRRFWPVVALLATLVLLAAALGWRWRGLVHSPLPQAALPPAAQTITIRPLNFSTPSVDPPQQPQPPPPQPRAEQLSPPNADENVPVSPSLRLGTLQVETSERR